MENRIGRNNKRKTNGEKDDSIPKKIRENIIENTCLEFIIDEELSYCLLNFAIMELISETNEEYHLNKKNQYLTFKNLETAKKALILFNKNNEKKGMECQFYDPGKVNKNILSNNFKLFHY